MLAGKHTKSYAIYKSHPMAMKAMMGLAQGPVRISSSSLVSGKLAMAPQQVILHVVAPHGRVTTDGTLVGLFPCVPSNVTL